MANEKTHKEKKRENRREKKQHRNASSNNGAVLPQLTGERETQGKTTT
jgi:hypothetical protein